MLPRVSCTGAPRDLGLDQGRACRDAIRADARALGWDDEESGWLARLRGAVRRRPRGAGPSSGLARDLARHFPHLDERLTGLAAGAGLPRQALLVLLEEELTGEGVVLDAGIVRRAGRAPAVAVRLRSPWPPTGLVARTTTPDGGYRNLALARPALVAALAGVNERGLAGAALLLDAPAAKGHPAAASGAAGTGADARAEGSRAPSLLLLEQCLERLDTVEKALEWCERRPGGGCARLVFADAAGAVGAIVLDGTVRVRCAPQEIDALGKDFALLDPGARSLRAEHAALGQDTLALGA